MPPRTWVAVGAVATGTFAMVTAEQLPVGLLLPIGSSLHVSEGTAGLMVTVPGLVAAAASLLVPVAAGGLDRRRLLVALIALLAAASTVSALSDSFALMLASRFIVGLGIGGFWAIAGTIAARLLPAPWVARGTTLVFSGIAAATVLGVPAGTLVGELAGWRAAFAALAGLGLAVLAALVALLPPLAPERSLTPRELARQARNGGVRLVVIVTGLAVTGQFAAFTFVTPMLEQISGIDGGSVSSMLLAYGAAGVGGNLLAGIGGARNLPRTLVVILATVAAALLAFPLLGVTAAGGVGLLIVWGLAFGGFSVTMQSWALNAAPGSHEAASSLLACTFNTSIALGALFGGLAVDSLSVTAVPLLGGALMVVTLAALAAIARTGRGAGSTRRAREAS